MGFVGILTNSLRISRDSSGFLWDSVFCLETSWEVHGMFNDLLEEVHGPMAIL